MPRASIPASSGAGPADAPSREQIEGWSDEDLLLLVRSGDQAAFAELYRRYALDATRFARTLVAKDDVEDVVAESFAKVLRALNAGRGPVDFPVRYLMVTVRTTAASLHGRRARHRSIVARIGDEPLTTPPADLADEDLVEAFRRLHPRWRKVIWWTEIEGRPLAEIGEELGLRPTAVAALAYRARRALREAYEELTGSSDSTEP